MEITHMELETFTDYDAYYEAYNETYKGTRCYDTIHFEWVNKGGETVEHTDPQCGCLGENHLSCDEHPFDDYYMAVTEKPTQYNLVGTDVKLVLWSDGSVDGGKIKVDWKCNTQTTTTPTTLLTTSGRS